MLLASEQHKHPPLKGSQGQLPVNHLRKLPGWQDPGQIARGPSEHACSVPLGHTLCFLSKQAVREACTPTTHATKKQSHTLAHGPQAHAHAHTHTLQGSALKHAMYVHDEQGP
eukprot:1160950-Pelagomonas_calceolata.AAC.9